MSTWDTCLVFVRSYIVFRDEAEGEIFFNYLVPY